MHRVEEGNLETRVEESKIREIGELQRSFNTMVRQITTLMELTREEESKLQEAERKALEAQMNPHFLYNTLNTVKSIARMHDEQEIYTIITKLGKLLRDAIDNREGETTLAESFSLVENYLTIQKIRYGEKLHTIVELDETIASLKTPKLIIQPLVENAIIHGLEPKIGIWRLTVRARLEAKMVIISVADNGVGFSRNIRFKNGFSLDEANHVGLSNIQRRLKLRYGELSDLSVDSVPHEGTIVTIHIPFPRED
jgi:two-component system sensor histidine kinase YesM